MMKRTLLLITTLLSCILGNAQVSFSSKAEAMDYSRKAHNGSLVSLQEYISSHSVDDLVTALVLSGRASSVAQDCVSSASDILSYGSDAVKIVKINNFLMAYCFHEVKYRKLGSKGDGFPLATIMQQYEENLLWMANMIVYDENNIKWLYGSLTMKDVAGILAFVQFMEEDDDWAENERQAGDRSIIKMIDRQVFDLNCFMANGKWNFFYMQ